MKRSLLSITIIALITLNVSGYKKQSIDINVNGQKRNMVVFKPNKMQPKMPLFIVTHGMNQSPEYQLDSDKMYEMIDTAKFVITYLRSNGTTWDTGGTNDQTFVSKTIDAMADSFDIDKDRVYWSGFSMGSMLIHHCIANMQNKIAAFAPTSGIQFSESPWNNCKKPVNLLECIAYGDDVFGYEKYSIHAYIENYAKHDKHTQYSKTTSYKPISSSWYNGDLEKWTGGANGGEVWLYSYNNGGHWPMDLNRHLIWNFCKRFTLNQPQARITEPSGETTQLYMGPKDETQFPDIAVKATAKAIVGKVAKVEFYDGKTFLDSMAAAPYTATMTAPTSGKHSLRVVVTDNNGKTGEFSCLVNNVAQTSTTSAYTLSQTFKLDGTVPQNWYVSNGSTKRVGGGLAFTSGCRVLKFTSTQKAFTYGLLVQNATTKAKNAWAKFGDKTGRSHMTLSTGHYVVKYKVCNWNQPDFTPVTVAIETTDGQEVASQTYTPTVNIGNNVANKETGDYILAFYADAAKNADFVLGSVTIQAKSFGTTGIYQVNEDIQKSCLYAYDLSGRQLSRENLKPGLYIIDRRKVVIK